MYETVGMWRAGLWSSSKGETVLGKEKGKGGQLLPQLLEQRALDLDLGLDWALIRAWMRDAARQFCRGGGEWVAKMVVGWVLGERVDR